MRKTINGEYLSALWLIVLISIIIKSNLLLISIYQIKTENILNLLIFGVFTIMPCFLLLSFSFLFSQKGKLAYLFGLDVFISLLFIVDIVYARGYGHLISIYMMFAKGVTEGLNASIISLIKWTDFLMLIDLPFLFIAFLKSKRKNANDNIKKRILKFSSTLVFSVAIICFEFITIGSGNLLSDTKHQALYLSPIGSHMFDVYRFIYDRTDKLNNEDISKVNNWLEKNATYQDPDKGYADLKGLIKGRNLIVVQFESLENIVIGKSYYGQEITPNINRLLASSIYFNKIHEQVRDGNSSDTELMFNTSIYPISMGSAFLRFGENTYNSLTSILDYDGYTSIAIHGDDKEFWNRNLVFPALGFDRYIAEDEFDNNTSVGMGILDEYLFAQSFSEIEKLQEPYYLFIITLTSHMPWDAAKDVGVLDLPSDDETARYLQTINYTDKCLGEFYNELEKRGLLKNTVIIIYGDHEGIHKYNTTTTLPDNNKTIPFLIHIPGMSGMVINKIGGQVDMMPTVAFLLGIDKENYATGVMGLNLLGNDPGAVILPDGEIIGQVEDNDHLKDAQKVADIIIKGNYFKVENK